MTTKNEQPTRLAQILEHPEADQGYPVWEEASVWKKLNALAKKPAPSKRRKYWLWAMAFMIVWAATGTERLEVPEKIQPASSKEIKPMAQVELQPTQEVGLIRISAPKVHRKDGSISPILLSYAPTTPPPSDSTYHNKAIILETIDALPALASLSKERKVLLGKKPLLPPQPWRKKYSTLYTLRVPEIPFDWDVHTGFVQRLERQLKFNNQPGNGWIAFQVHWDSGTAFTLVHQSRDSIAVQHPEIQLHHTKH